MKIGLLTFQRTTNFGSFLQMYALYKCVCNLGFDCEVIDYACKTIEERELPVNKPQSMKVKEIIGFLLFEPRIRKKYSILFSETKKYINFSRRYEHKDIILADSQYDIFLVGSDILWDMNLTEDKTYFLDFVSDSRKKIAFSTSIGRRWEENEIKLIVPLISDFQHIALREKKSIEWIGDLVNIKIDAVCDPTMLVERATWDEMSDCNKVKRQDKGYVLLYFNSKEMISDAKSYAKANHLRVVSINYGRKISGVENIRPYSVSEFLFHIKNAEAVFTASYHGMLFALYFEKKLCIYFRQRGHNVRFEDVINKLELRRYEMKGKMSGIFLDINYNEITPGIEKWRTESMKILQSYLMK